MTIQKVQYTTNKKKLIIYINLRQKIIKIHSIKNTKMGKGKDGECFLRLWLHFLTFFPYGLKKNRREVSFAETREYNLQKSSQISIWQRIWSPQKYDMNKLSDIRIQKMTSMIYIIYYLFPIFYSKNLVDWQMTTRGLPQKYK